MIPDLWSPRNLVHPLQNDPVSTISQFNHGLTQLAPVPPLRMLTSALSRSFWQTRQSTKSGGTGASCVVDPLNCLHQVVLEGISQVSRPSEVGNHKRCTLNTWLSFGFCGNFFFCCFSAATQLALQNFCSVRGPLHKLPCRSRYEKRTWHGFCTSSKKRVENWILRFKPKISFSRGRVWFCLNERAYSMKSSLQSISSILFLWKRTIVW